MANEPERPIEKLLRAAANKRRDEGGALFELHPATRRLLQGEVARQFPTPQRQTGPLSLLLAQLWPRLAWGVGILAALGAAVWLVLPGMQGEKSAALLAGNQPVPEAAPAKEPLPPAPIAPAAVPPPPSVAAPAKPLVVAYADKEQPERRSAAPQPGLEQKQLAKDDVRAPAATEPLDKVLPAAGLLGADRKQAAEVALAGSGGAPAPAPAGTISGTYDRPYGLAGTAAPPANAPATPAAPPAVATTAAAASAVAADESLRLKNNEAGRPALAYRSLTESASANRLKPLPAATDGLAKSYAAAFKEEKSPRVSQRFTRVTTGSKATSAITDKVTPAPTVLASFQVEQSGLGLRIVDGDGSVYSGYVQIADTTRRARAVRVEAPAAAPASRVPTDALEDSRAARLDTDQLPPPSYSFRVTGTNLSLHKKVVFTGNLLPAARAASQPPIATNLAAGTSLGGLQTGSAQPRPLPLLNARLAGKLVIGNGKAVEINAEPASP